MASAAWERRNEAARALGYRNAYDYRVHNYGKSPPSAPAATGEQLSTLRGHRGAADLQTAVDSGRVVMVFVNPTTADANQRWTTVEVTLVLDDGTERVYRLRRKDLNYDTAMPLLASTQGAGVPVADRYDVLGWALEHYSDVEDFYTDEDYDEAA